MRLICDEEFKNDLEELLRAFLIAESGSGVFEDTENGILIDFAKKEDGGREDAFLEAYAEYRETRKSAVETIFDKSHLALKRQKKRMLKRLLYDMLSELQKKTLPYGSLTGVRPTKLAYEYFETKGSDATKAILTEYYRVSDSKSALILEILKNQKGIYDKTPKLFDIYINIPFCPTRCSYCSFVTSDIKRAKKFLEPYIKCLIEEIDLIFELSGGRCNALYIGGGTPTAIDNDGLERILRAVSRFKFNEFTVEAGRPDSINDGNLSLIKESGAGRVSVNPQSFNQKTLDIIGRSHTAKDIYTAFERARRFGFDINTDIIAMLPDESVEDFLYTVERCVELSPENITAHNLSLKRGSRLKLGNFNMGDAETADEMTERAYETLKRGGYAPYYMYRQKYMSGNLENCGYTKPGRACAYNIDIMEETHSILSAGAGAISKRVVKDKIDRLANIKDVAGYIERHEETLKKKRDFFGL
ncbi:MAG: coproporphyrinogen dehydrogenase HemZ [Clostridiales bacterium]|jgi:oxygen-independent coproporphyrinogen-3 oxidase|nr:coproporphyrinogen dehydrogenase HemZ [Clostridiales bacterium]